MSKFLDYIGLQRYHERIQAKFDAIFPNSENETSDLDIIDSAGNVLVRCYNGHIKTKYFDSTNAPSITVSSVEPTSSDGNDGDIWIVI